MGEQARRTVDLEPQTTVRRRERKTRSPASGPSEAELERSTRAQSREADERQTALMAPGTAAPGESAEDDSIA